jgi:hypothetical protein
LRVFCTTEQQSPEDSMKSPAQARFAQVRVLLARATKMWCDLYGRSCISSLTKTNSRGPTTRQAVVAAGAAAVDADMYHWWQTAAATWDRGGNTV